MNLITTAEMLLAIVIVSMANGAAIAAILIIPWMDKRRDEEVAEAERRAHISA